MLRLESFLTPPSPVAIEQEIYQESASFVSLSFLLALLLALRGATS